MDRSSREHHRAMAYTLADYAATPDGAAVAPVLAETFLQLGMAPAVGETLVDAARARQGRG